MPVTEVQMIYECCTFSTVITGFRYAFFIMAVSSYPYLMMVFFPFTMYTPLAICPFDSFTILRPLRS